MNARHFLSLVFLMSLVAGCSSATIEAVSTSSPTALPSLQFSQPTSPSVELAFTPNPAPTIAPTALPNSPQQAVIDKAFSVVTALKDRDLVQVAAYVDPLKGLRFSPYATVKDGDQVFTADTVTGLFDDTSVYTWGNYDGTGEPINLAFSDYYAKFVYDEDFANPAQLSLNHRLGTGNSIDNIQEYYPRAMVIEFFFPGFDAQFEGMDWRSLRLVFVQENSDWYLAGIIHDQWTT